VWLSGDQYNDDRWSGSPPSEQCSYVKVTPPHYHQGVGLPMV
jgi:hypothetical protein